MEHPRQADGRGLELRLDLDHAGVVGLGPREQRLPRKRIGHGLGAGLEQLRQGEPYLDVFAVRLVEGLERRLGRCEQIPALRLDDGLRQTEQRVAQAGLGRDEVGVEVRGLAPAPRGGGVTRVVERRGESRAREQQQEQADDRATREPGAGRRL